MNNPSRTIAYIGIYPPTAPRDKVYLSGLTQNGFEVIECVSRKLGLSKYVELFRLLKKVIHDVDVVWVGYLSVGAVVVAFLVGGGKKIVYNALSSSYESYILDRRAASRFSLKAVIFWLADFLAFHLAHVILVESESQKKFLARQFLVSSSRLHVVYTGVDEAIFHPDQSVEKNKEFTVVFRGIFIPATGVSVVLEAAKLLKNEPIRFWISGWGQLLDEVFLYMETHELKKVELNTLFLEPPVLRRKMLSGHVLLGQFSGHERLNRTIQHKTSEALALGMPYITRDSVSNRELLTDGENCLFVPPDDARALADKILYLKAHPEVAQKIAASARETYVRELSPAVIGKQLLEILA